MTTDNDNSICYFVLAGQSNALGFAHLDHLQQLALSSGDENDRRTFSKYYNAQANRFRTNQKVYASFFREYGARFTVLVEGRLNPTLFGSDVGLFGPEVGFGWALQEALDEEIVLVKTAGVGSLAIEWRPPSSDGSTGDFWNFMVQDIHSTMDRVQDITLGQYTHAQLCGMVWWHGYADVYVDDYREEYLTNLLNFVHDVRIHFNQLDLPILVVQIGGDGTTTTNVNKDEEFLRNVQQQVVDENDFTALVETAKYMNGYNTSDPSQVFDGAHHYYGRADLSIWIAQDMAAHMMHVRNPTLAPTLAPSTISQRSNPPAAAMINNNMPSNSMSGPPALPPPTMAPTPSSATANLASGSNLLSCCLLLFVMLPSWIRHHGV